MAGSWSCPHETNGLCAKLKNIPCNPGMKGCTLAGRFVFFNEDKNERLREKMARRSEASEASSADAGENDIGGDGAS